MRFLRSDEYRTVQYSTVRNHDENRRTDIFHKRGTPVMKQKFQVGLLKMASAHLQTAIPSSCDFRESSSSLISLSIGGGSKLH